MSARWATYVVYVQTGKPEEGLLALSAELGDAIELDYQGEESY